MQKGRNLTNRFNSLKNQCALAALDAVSTIGTVPKPFVITSYANTRIGCLTARQDAWANKQAAHLLEEPLAALMSSSARHSAMVLMFLKEASRAPVLIR